MNSPTHPWRRPPGFSLAEAVVAAGVLAVALPLGFAALAEAGRCAAGAQAETRSTWIIPACMEEIRASRRGRSPHLTATVNGEPFPPAGESWALAFASDGTLVGAIPRPLYDQGTRQVAGRNVSYVVSLASSPAAPQADAPVMLETHLMLEYPAASPALHRRKLAFHTRLP